MYGAILGDIIGSPFEFDRGDKTKEFDLFTKGCDFTDDSVMTIAVAEALLAVGPEATVKEIQEAVVTNMQDWGKRYPHAGYGGSFRHWLKEKNPKPYGSYGNGSAMRVSAAGWLYDSIERTREVARATANVTHNHPEGIKGAEATASAIYMARNGSSKEEIKEYIEREFHYDLSRTLDNIRPYYHHVESCQETVPEAISAFLESKDFEDAVRNAVSLGGDTDTLGAITGSIAEAFYGIPAVLIAECKSRIDKGLMTDVLDEFDHVLGRSVDTYSDEVDEIQANQMIEAAIDQYYIQQDKNGMLLFMEVMVTRMQQAGEVIVPYITENSFMSEEQIGKVKAGDTISLDHDVRLKIETVKDADEKEWIGVFTSSEEMHKEETDAELENKIKEDMQHQLVKVDKNGEINDESYRVNVRGAEIEQQKAMVAIVASLFMYIAFILISAVGTILAVQSLSDSTKYKYRYLTLRRLGINDKSLFKTIRKQLLILFCVPAISAILCSFVMMSSLNNVYQQILGDKHLYLMYFGLNLIIFFLIYSIYWIATYIGFKRNINEES